MGSSPTPGIFQTSGPLGDRAFVHSAILTEMSGEPPQNGVPEPRAGPEPSGALGGGAELVVGSMIELVQRLSDGQRGQTEV